MKEGDTLKRERETSPRKGWETPSRAGRESPSENGRKTTEAGTPTGEGGADMQMRQR